MTTQWTDNKVFLKIAEILEKEEISRSELQQKLNIKTKTFYKYLKIIKQAGFIIDRNDDLYRIESFKEALKFARYEKNLFSYLLLLGIFVFSKSKYSNLNRALKKMITLSDKDDYCQIKENCEYFKVTTLRSYYKKKITLLENSIQKNKNVIIDTKKGEKKHFKPIDFNYSEEDMYLNFIDIENNAGSIALKDIIKIKPDDNFNVDTEEFKKDRVIFELYGKLVNSYLLKDDERIIDNLPDKIVIASSNPDEKKLFKRLLRYDTLCKVTFPEEAVKNFKEMLEKTLDNLN